jgi:hypothetical protein
VFSTPLLPPENQAPSVNPAPPTPPDPNTGTPAASNPNYNTYVSVLSEQIDGNDARIGAIDAKIEAGTATIGDNVERNTLIAENAQIYGEIQDIQNADIVDSQSNLPSADYNDVNNVPYDPGTYGPTVPDGFDYNPYVPPDAGPVEYAGDYGGDAGSFNDGYYGDGGSMFG